jgi:hypothetical protein
VKILYPTEIIWRDDLELEVLNNKLSEEHLKYFYSDGSWLGHH